MCPLNRYLMDTFDKKVDIFDNNKTLWATQPQPQAQP